MSTYRINISDNFFIITDVDSGVEVIREVRDTVKYHVFDDADPETATGINFAFFYKSAIPTPNQGLLALGGEITSFPFSQLVDASGNPFISVAGLKNILNSRLGHISDSCCDNDVVPVDFNGLEIEHEHPCGDRLDIELTFEGDTLTPDAVGYVLGTVGIELSCSTPLNAVRVTSGSLDHAHTGTFIHTGTLNSRPTYEKIDDSDRIIYYDGDKWVLEKIGGGAHTHVAADGTEDFPWLADWSLEDLTMVQATIGNYCGNGGDTQDVFVNGVDEGDLNNAYPVEIFLTDGTDPVTPTDVTVVGNGVTITAPNTAIEVNGVAEGSVNAGATVDVQLFNSDGVVTPLSVTQVGSNFEVELDVAPSGEWVRNPDWLPLPAITSSDNRFVGLFLVFENEYNQLTVNATNNAANIDWGDGSSVTSNGNTQTKVYDYSTISGTVSQYYDGRNYKQVIVDITRLNTLTSLLFANNSLSAINNLGTINFVDIVASLPETTALVLSASNARQLRICEKIELLSSVDNTYQNAFISLPLLQYLVIPFSHLTNNSQVTTMFQRALGNIKFFNNENIDIDSPVLTSMFNGSWIRKVGNISSSGGATLTGSVFQNSAVEQVGNVTLPNATDLSNFFYQTFNLHTIGVINAPSAVGLGSMFTGCNCLREIIFTDCSNVTTVTTGSQGTFNLCHSLTKLIMPGMMIGFSIAGCNLTAQALNDLFTSLGTASGSQTIIVTGNPGAATCDTTIATAKGFTVTT